MTEGLLIGSIGFLASFAVSPVLGKVTASYLAAQAQTQQTQKEEADQANVLSDYVEPDLTIQEVDTSITGVMAVADGAAVAGLVFLSVSVSGIVIMRKEPKEILSEMD